MSSAVCDICLQSNVTLWNLACLGPNICQDSAKEQCPFGKYLTTMPWSYQVSWHDHYHKSKLDHGMVSILLTWDLISVFSLYLACHPNRGCMEVLDFWCCTHFVQILKIPVKFYMHYSMTASWKFSKNFKCNLQKNLCFVYATHKNLFFASFYHFWQNFFSRHVNHYHMQSERNWVVVVIYSFHGLLYYDFQKL